MRFFMEQWNETLNREEQLDDESQKRWLFKENIRIQQERNRLNEDKKRFEGEEQLFQKKLDILKDAYLQLDVDKRKLEWEKQQLLAKKEQLQKQSKDYQVKEPSYFKGVNSLLALKKRYKDLIKIYHPDNLCGDTDTIQIINREYDNLRKVFDYHKQA